MGQGAFSFQYVVVDQDGNQSDRYQLKSKYDNSRGAAYSAAEDYSARPEAASANWPLTFVVFNMKGDEFCRYKMKRWLVPHFLIIGGTEPSW